MHWTRMWVRYRRGELRGRGPRVEGPHGAGRGRCARMPSGGAEGGGKAAGREGASPPRLPVGPQAAHRCTPGSPSGAGGGGGPRIHRCGPWQGRSAPARGVRGPEESCSKPVPSLGAAAESGCAPVCGVRLRDQPRARSEAIAPPPWWVRRARAAVFSRLRMKRLGVGAGSDSERRCLALNPAQA